MSSCCPPEPEHHHDHEGDACHLPSGKPDYLFWGSSAIILLGLLGWLFNLPVVATFGHHVWAFLSTMWWGVLIGLFFVGLFSRVPKEYFAKILGRGDTVGGVFRAAGAGLLLDLCSHGILMVGAKLYERGASLAQLLTFLIASPWNSISLTFILFALIGVKWTLVFILGSAVIAVVTGLIVQMLVKNGTLPANPHSIELPADFNMVADAKARLKTFKPTKDFWITVVRDGWHDGKMVLRWLMVGVVLAALLRTFISVDDFATWFGPTMTGLLLTLIATTIIEVCSEGSSPIGADLVTRAAAPGNGFAFMMAGVATDYTEIMVLKNLTGSWKIALVLPLLTVPQVLLLGWVLNQFG